VCFKLGLPWKGNFPARIQQVFDRFDKDGGGSLDRTELQPLGRKAERMERMERMVEKQQEKTGKE
jgi:Ca2+-binding EF-hand superfamily protein